MTAESPSQADAQAAGEGGLADDHPEVLVGAAFVGGFVLAQILKQLGE